MALSGYLWSNDLIKEASRKYTSLLYALKILEGCSGNRDGRRGRACIGPIKLVYVGFRLGSGKF